MVTQEKSAPSDSGAAQASAAIGADIIDSSRLLGEQGEVKISHNGELYSLRKTRNGKLILTK